jgi:hypothetical protein
MTKKVFISYRSTEGLAADALINVIQELGDYEVWYDQALQGGQKWWDEIIRQIELADVVILALSGAYLASEPCKREREYADQLGKAVIPVQIDPDLDFNRLDAVLKATQMVRYHPYARDKDRLATALAGAESPPLPDNRQAPSPPIDSQVATPAAQEPGDKGASKENRVVIIVALIGAVATLFAAVIGILPALLNNPGSPTPTSGGAVQATATSAGNITPIPTVQAVSGAFDITFIYGDRDSFTIRANAESHLWGLTISSNVGTEIPAESFPALAETGYIVAADTCLRYGRAGETPPRPRGCSDTATFSIELLDADIFWYDTGSNQLKDVALRQDGTLISLCSSASRQCDLSTP